MMLTGRGEVFSWVGGKEWTPKPVAPALQRVDALSGLVVSRVACSGAA